MHSNFTLAQFLKERIAFALQRHGDCYEVYKWILVDKGWIPNDASQWGV